ncbi:MAG: hypothetical protein ABI068_02020 [Ktedonobacterales bacterium]
MIEQTRTVEEAPIACMLTGDELTERGSEVGAVFQAVEQVRELADGYEFRFPGSDAIVSGLLGFMLAERRCCPFFTFELVFEPNLSAIWVRLRGSTAVKEFVAAAWGEIIAAHV